MAYIGNDLRSNEDYKIIDDISSGFNGSATSFALQVGGATPVPFPKFEQQLLISVNGVIQEPDPTGSAGFKLSGTNIVFSSAPTNGHAFFGVIYAGADYVNAGGTFPDGSINFPSITFSADTNTGFTRTASGTVALISDGTKVAQFPTSQGSSGQALITDGGGNLSFGVPTAAFTDITLADSIIHSGDTNTKIRFPAADTVSVETTGSEKLRITSAGLVLVGHDADKSGGDTNALLQLFTPTAAKLLLGRSDTSISSGNFLGIIDFHGTDGTSSQRGARIGAVASGDHGTDDKPTDLVFQTTADGAGSSTERMRIESDGNVRITSQHLRFDTTGKGIIFGIEGGSDRPSIVGNYTSSTNNNIAFNTTGSERMRIDMAGRLLIGHSVSQTIGSNSHPLVQLNVNSNQQVLTLARFENSSAGPGMVLGKSRASSAGNYTVVQNGDGLGTITFSGADGTDLISRGAAIEAQVDGTPGNNDMPGRLVFMTTADDSDSPTERMRIDSSGVLSIGTTSPNGSASKLQVEDSGENNVYFVGNTTTSGARLILQNKNTTANSFTGVLGADGGGQTTASINFYSADNDTNEGYLTLETRPASGIPTEALRIDSSGNVGLGVTSVSDARFRIKGANNTTTAFNDGLMVTSNNETVYKKYSWMGIEAKGGMVFSETNSGSLVETMRIDSSGTVFVGTTNVGGGSGGVRFKNPDVGSSRFGTTITSGSKTLIQFISNGANNIVGSIGVTTTATDFSTSSDYRLKENESLISDGITRLKQLKPYKFNWKSDSSTKVDGFFAHEVSSIVPEAVTGIKDAVAVQEDVDQGIADAIGEPIYQGIDQSKLVPLLTAALQEEIAKREALETRIAALEAV